MVKRDVTSGVAVDVAETPSDAYHQLRESIVNGEPDPIELLRAGEAAAVRSLIADHQRTFAPA